jgi:hypothetical protein
MMTNLELSPETQITDIESHLIDAEPGGLFPIGQDSIFGQMRRVRADAIQVLADQLRQWYLNLDPATVDNIDMAMWEQLLGIPTSNVRAIEARRAFIVSRRIRGPFTRTRRRVIVEAFILATFGAAPRFSDDGIPLTSAGLPLYADITSLAGSYLIVENIPGFTYTVYIKNPITVDATGLTRELARITPEPITFTISNVNQLPFTALGISATATVGGNVKKLISISGHINAISAASTVSGGVHK